MPAKRKAPTTTIDKDDDDEITTRSVKRKFKSSDAAKAEEQTIVKPVVVLQHVAFTVESPKSKSDDKKFLVCTIDPSQSPPPQKSGYHFQTSGGTARYFADQKKQVEVLHCYVTRYGEVELQLRFGSISKETNKFVYSPVTFYESFAWAESFLGVPIDDAYADTIDQLAEEEHERRMIRRETEKIYKGSVRPLRRDFVSWFTPGKPYSELRGDLIGGACMLTSFGRKGKGRFGIHCDS